MPRDTVTDAQLQEHLKAHPEWTVKDGALHREFSFPDFVSAFGFMASAALVAERMNHHPDWSNVYGTVEVALSTHDAGGITASDLELSAAMDDIAKA